MEKERYADTVSETIHDGITQCWVDEGEKKMLLSEIFEVKRGEPFMVEECADRFMVVVNDFYTEFLRIQGHGKGEWIDASPYAVYEVIKSAPYGIIHLPPPLTDEQREQLQAIWTLGGRWLAKDNYRDNAFFTYVNKPYKKDGGYCWWSDIGGRFMVLQSLCVCKLVSWSDPEPYDIGKALGVGE